MKRIATITLALIVSFLLVFPGGASGQSKSSFGFFNDGDRSVAGRGCQLPGLYPSPCPDHDPPITEPWAWGEAWLWMCAQESGVERIKLGYELFIGLDVGDECDVGEVLYNSPIIAYKSWPQLSLFSVMNYDIGFSQCLTGWHWILKMRLWRPGGWNLLVIPYYVDGYPGVKPRIYRCGSTEAEEAIIYSHFILDPVQPEDWQGGDLIGVERTTWGAIKSLFR